MRFPHPINKHLKAQEAALTPSAQYYFSDAQVGPENRKLIQLLWALIYIEKHKPSSKQKPITEKFT